MPPSFLATPESKRYYNRSLFRIVAPRYAVATRVLSLGRDSAWKRRAIALLPRDVPDGVVVDVASGSGDLAMLLCRRYARRTCIAADLTPAMTRVAAARLGRAAALTIQDMCRLGLADSSAAIVSGGYALRNAPDLGVALAEIYRVLKPGASAVFLEFSRSPLPVFAFCQHFVLKAWGLWWGLLLHGSPRVYGYIADSLAAYPDRASLHSLCKQAGFLVVASELKMFGLIEILLLKKPDFSPQLLCLREEALKGNGASLGGYKATGSHATQPWWPDLSARSRDKELMDMPEAPGRELATSLGAFRTINYLVSPFRRRFKALVLADATSRRLTKATLCDLGAGGGDLGLWCGRLLRKNGIAAAVLHVDSDWRVVRYLKERTRHDPASRVVCADAAAGCFKHGSVDYCLSNHMLHHCDESAVAAILENMRRMSRYGFLTTDLLRRRLAYIGFWMLSVLFFRGGFNRYDGLLSIRRGFTMGELAALVRRASGEGRIKVRPEGVGHFSIWGMLKTEESPEIFRPKRNGLTR